MRPDSCSNEAAFFWRFILEYLNKKQKDEAQNKKDYNLMDSNEDAVHQSSLKIIQQMLDIIQPCINIYVDFSKK